MVVVDLSANLLTGLETHMTQTAYDRAFVAKHFCFQFVNSCML